MINAVVLLCAVAQPGASEIAVPIARVKDGDTFEAGCTDRFGKPEVYRIAGIDTPESNGRAKCPHESTLANLASANAKVMAARAGMVAQVSLPVAQEKYGRYLAKVSFIIDGQRVEWAQAQIAAGYAKPYYGSKKTEWCKM